MAIVIHCKVQDVDAQLAADCVEEFLDEKAEPEVFLAWMYSEGYDMRIFEGKL